MPDTILRQAFAWYRGSIAEHVGELYEVRPGDTPGRYELWWAGKRVMHHVRPESIEWSLGYVEPCPQPEPVTRVPAYQPAGPGTGTHYFHARRNEVLPRDRYAGEDGNPCVLWLTQTFVDV